MLTPDEIQRVLAAARGCGKRGGAVVSLDDLIEDGLIRQAKEAGIGPMPSVEEILDRVLRATFDWWGDREQRDIANDGGDDMEKFIGMAKEVCRQNFTAPVYVPAADELAELIREEAFLAGCTDEQAQMIAMHVTADEPAPAPCPECGGDRYINQRMSVPTRTAGFGIYRVPCPECFGKKYRNVGSAAVANAVDYAIDPCPKCGGDKEVPQYEGDLVTEVVPCPRCAAQPAPTRVSEPCPQCVEFARLFSTVHVATIHDPEATEEDMRRSLVECRGAVWAAAKVWEQVSEVAQPALLPPEIMEQVRTVNAEARKAFDPHDQPAPFDVVVPRDVAEKGYAAAQVCVGAILGGNLAFGAGTDAVLRHLQALASALRQGR